MENLQMMYVLELNEARWRIFITILKHLKEPDHKDGNFTDDIF